MTKTRKSVLAVLTVIVLIRILYICISGNVNNDYNKSYSIDLTNVSVYPCVNLTERFVSQKERLYGINLIFTGIADDRTGNITLQICFENNLIYQTNIALDNIVNGEWKFVYINAPLDIGQAYELHLTSSDDCIQVPNVIITMENLPPEILGSYLGESLIDGQIAIEYEYIQPLCVSERLVLSSFWMFFLLIAYVIVLFFDRILNQCRLIIQFLCSPTKADVLIIITELLGCLIILNCSGIDFQNPTKILCYIISLFAATKIDSKRNFVHKIADTKSKQALLYMLYIYAGFALVGQRILVYPLTLKIQAAGIFVFAVTILWFVPIIQTLLYMSDQLGNIVFSKKQTMNLAFFIILILCLLFVPALYALYAFNPGISTSDTYSCMVVNAHNLHGMYDWHPAYYSIILNIILSIWDSTYAVIFVQYFFWGYVFIELFLYLRKKGIGDSILLIAALFTGINASNFVHLNTIWKDIPYSISLLWVSILLAKLSLDFEKYRKKRYIYLELIIALINVFFIRKNGVVPFVVVSAMLIIVLRKSKKIWGTLIITTALIFIIKGPVYNYLDIQNTGRHGMYIGLGQDILGVYYAHGEVSQETLSMINAMTRYNNAEYDYTPTWSRQSYDIGTTPREFIFNYIDTFIKNPIIMSRAIIARVDAIWDIYAGADSYLGGVSIFSTMDGRENWNDYYPKRIPNALYETMASASDYTAFTQWISAIEWRCGLFTFLGLTAFVYAYVRYGLKKYILISAPIIGQILGLLLSTGWSDFRYFWPLNLINFTSILLIWVIPKCDEVNAIPSDKG